MNKFTLSLLLIVGLSLSLNLTSLAQKMTPAQLVQKQLDAYNTGDLEAFVAVFSDSIKIYNFPNDLRYQGIENFRKMYGKMFNELPDLHCTIVNRTVMGNTVIDHEQVVVRKGEAIVEVLAIYKIKDEKIVEVYFIRK